MLQQIKTYIMNNFNYKGIEYPTRTFDIQLTDDNEIQLNDGSDIKTITIASSLLDEALGDSQDFGEKEEYIDDQIYFYVDEEFFHLDAETICREHLDEPFVLITEY